jgi:monofunctional biosynthetic peptidoglycan transglycosylase
MLKKTLTWFLIAAVAAVCVLGTYIHMGLPDVRKLQHQNPTTTALIENRVLQAQQSNKILNIRQHWVEFNAIPQLLKDTIRITEDAAFYQHNGIDYTQLKEAIKKNWEKGKYARGGSTITQQLAKNLYLSTDKSILRKIKEYFIARRLEANLSKDRIFHVYLNIIEMGAGIFGVQAASNFYFNKHVNELDLEEIVRLTAIIPRPLKIDPRGESKWLKWKANWILDALKRYQYIHYDEHQAVARRFQ